MKSICVVLTILAVVHVTQAQTNAQTPTNRSKVIERRVLGCPDGLAVIEYGPEHDEVVVTTMHLNRVLAEYQRLKVKPNLNDQEYRRFVALVIAIGTYPT